VLVKKLALALDAARRVAELLHFVIDAPPQLALFAFHLEWSSSTLEAKNAATRELLERVTRSRVMLTGCEAGTRFLGRVCVLHFRTHQERIDDSLGNLAEEAAAIID
jgi:hypothetical protein